MASQKFISHTTGQLGVLLGGCAPFSHQELQAARWNEESGTLQAFLSLGSAQPESLATVLLSKHLGFPNPPFVTHAQRHQSGPEMLGQEPQLLSDGHQPAENVSPDGPLPWSRSGSLELLVAPSLPGPSIRPVFLAWKVDLSER